MKRLLARIICFWRGHGGRWFPSATRADRLEWRCERCGTHDPDGLGLRYARWVPTKEADEREQGEQEKCERYLAALEI